MICLRAYEVVKGYKGKLVLGAMHHFKNLKWPNDYDFGFDIYNPENWRRFLEKYQLRPGFRLPRKGIEGHPLAYNVYFWGSPRGVTLAFRPNAHTYSLFPGNEENGNRKDLAVHGILR